MLVRAVVCGCVLRVVICLMFAGNAGVCLFLLLLVVYCLLCVLCGVVCCVLLAASCLLCAVCRLLCVDDCCDLSFAMLFVVETWLLLFVVRGLLAVVVCVLRENACDCVCCLLSVVCCVLCGGGCVLLCGICCVLCVVCCLYCVVCCLLCVAGCLLVVV